MDQNIHSTKAPVKETQAQFEAKLKGPSIAPQTLKIIPKVISKAVPKFGRGTASAIIQQKKTPVSFGQNFTREQEALRQMFGGGGKVWGLGGSPIKNVGALRSGAGPTKWDERRETASLMFKK